MKFAANKISILPDEPTALSGIQFRNTNAPTLGIHECNLRMAWLQLDQDNELLFLLADLLFFPSHLAKLLAEYIEKKYGLPKSNIVFAATHNHSGPAFGFLPWEKENLQLEEKIFEKIKNPLDELKDALQEVNIEIATTGIKNISINRRKRIRHWKTNFARKALMFPNANGLTSDQIKAIKFVAKDGSSTLFLSYASHPVFNRNEIITSDYPGRVAHLCQAELGVKDAFCFQGFGGDIRPNFQCKKGFKAKLKSIFHGPEFADYTSLHFESFCQEIVAALKKASYQELKMAKATLAISENEMTLNSLSEKTRRVLKPRVISLSDELKWLVVNGELFCHYQKMLPGSYFAISCTADTIGYIPTADEVQWGGYEVEDAPLNNGMDGPIRPKDLSLVEDYFKKL